jgi:RNA polymerase sigma-70 factor (ECF subfamily)
MTIFGNGRESGRSAGKPSIEVLSLSRTPVADDAPADPFAEVYQAHFDFVWRLTRALGVELHAVDDVVHEVFLVLRRRLDAFDRERSMRAWLAGITRNLVMHHRRALSRRMRRIAALPEPDAPRRPDEWLALADAAAAMTRFLDGLDPAKREVFVLMEIERMTAREVEAIVGVHHRTLYTRLRAAREEFAAFARALEREGERR